jgi:hypothetical protein
MEVKKLCQMTDRVLPGCSSEEEFLVLEEWYRSCEHNPGLLQQFSKTEQELMRRQQLGFITARLSFGKGKVLLAVV